jgi:glutathione S-transferase
VILRFLDDKYPQPRIRRDDPLQHAVESMFAALDSPYAKAGYGVLMNQDPDRRAELVAAFDAEYAKMDAFLQRYGGDGPFLFEEFGWAEVVLTPLLKRLETLGYYEDYRIPEELERVRRWHAACLAHPAAQTRSVEEVLKLYYDYSRGVGGGRLVPGRGKSSFTMDPHWSTRPLPPRDKWVLGATDAELGLA